MTIKEKVKPPMMPNFYSTESGINKPIADFTEEQAQEYAKLMSDTFMEHWKKKIKK